MSILSQKNQADKINEINISEKLQEIIREMNLCGGVITETEEPILEFKSRLSGYKFKVSLKVELFR